MRILSPKECLELDKLRSEILADLGCSATKDANHHPMPCRTHRLDAVRAMTRYLEIHGLKVTGATP